MTFRIVNILGVSRSGKDTLRGYLEAECKSLVSLKFSYPMKRFCEDLYGLGWGALEDPDVRSSKVPGHPEGITFLEWMVRSAKHFRAVDPNIMVTPTLRDANAVLDSGRSVVFTDCRFQNELEAIWALAAERDLKILSIHVTRSGVVPQASDSEVLKLVAASQTMARLLGHGDLTLENKDLDTLKDYAKEISEWIK